MATPRADPETVLRLVGEQALLACSGARRGSVPDGSLSQVAAALCVLAGLPLERAQAVLDDYGTALSMRGQGMPIEMLVKLQQRGPQPEPEIEPLAMPTVRHAGATVQVGPDEVHVSSVVFHEDRTEVLVSYDRPPAFHQSRRRPRPVPVLPPAPRSLTLTDDSGMSSHAGFSGGGSDGRWSGHWSSSPPLSGETAWIELDGVRVDLAPAAPYLEVRVEDRPRDHLVHRFLWHQLASQDHHVLPAADPVLESLWALGLLSESDDPFLEAYQEVVTALQQWNTSSATTSAAVPPEWSSFLRRRTASPRTVQHEVEIPAVALTPEFDGVALLVYHLRSTPEGFGINAHARGPTGLVNGRSYFDNTVPAQVLAWWAEDDCGNAYLGQWGASSAGPHSIDGDVHFTPGIDRKATRLTLLPSTLRQRAVIEVPLP